MFHLDLHLPIARIHVVELFDARGADISLFLRIEFLVDMENLALATQEQAQSVESSMLIIVLACLHGKRVEQCGLNEPQTTKVEVVANAAKLVIYHGVSLALAFDHVVMVGIDHGRIRIRSHAQHTLEGILSHL